MNAIGTSTISMSFPTISYMDQYKKEVPDKENTSSKSFKLKTVKNIPSWEKIMEFITQTIEKKCAEKIENSIV